LAIFVLVIVVARFNSWDHFFFTFFKICQSLDLGVSVRVILCQLSQPVNPPSQIFSNFISR